MTAVASNFEQQVMAKIQSFGNQDLSNTSWVWAPVMSASRISDDKRSGNLDPGLLVDPVCLAMLKPS